MLTLDLILLRILFTGIATSLLLLIFWFLRRFCTSFSRQLILSRDNISRIFQHFLTGKDSAAVPFVYLLQSRGLLPVLSLGDWLVQYLPENRNRILHVETGIISYAEPREGINP